MDEQKLRDILGQDVEAPDMVNKKLENIYIQLEDRERPAKRKGLRSVRMTLIAAVLAAGCLLSVAVAAGLPGKIYGFATGGRGIVTPGEAWYDVDTQAGPVSPAEVRDGRLWFIADGQDIDITDLVDENTPYIYPRTDLSSGERGYIIVGGTPENFGFAEYTQIGSVSFRMSENASRDYVTLDGETIPYDELTDEQLRRVLVNDGTYPEGYGKINPDTPITTVDDPWLLAAKSKLGF